MRYRQSLIHVLRCRNILAWGCLLWGTLFGVVAWGAEFYVSPAGDDSGTGSVDAPFASVNKAQGVASPGDTIWIRGGRYVMTEEMIAQRGRGRAFVMLLNRSGQPKHPIRYWAFPDEAPVFDFSQVKPNGERVTGFHVSGSWLHLRGITVTGVQVTIKGHTQSICIDNEGDHNIYEHLTMRDGQAIGFWLGRGSHNLVLNCDAFQNHDVTSEDGRGGNVDGFGFHASKGSVDNIFRGCRAWFNSDDGFDFISSGEAVTVEQCWAFYNGYSPEFSSLADGNGFKAGGYARQPASRIPNPVPRHIVRQCVAVRNKASGFYANHHPGGIDFINNTAYRNGINFNLLGRDLKDVNKDVEGYGHVLRNNLGFRGRREVTNLNELECTVDSNSFQLPVHVTADDFSGLDEADLIRPRGPDGELPVTPFLRLVRESDLIDRGTDAGLPFTGIRPDLGAFEFTPEGEK
ncbi:MAG: right-handed parallel beta-helix repeat-containing protein [Planctomycetaceae bacterium]